MVIFFQIIVNINNIFLLTLATLYIYTPFLRNVSVPLSAWALKGQVYLTFRDRVCLAHKGIHIAS